MRKILVCIGQVEEEGEESEVMIVQGYSLYERIEKFKQ